ncbi:hypothetical protein IEU95_08445 [Hoyosella rhizosphaerae]|uniref:Transglutaminase-like domain-containing protein n=1 Tax=Hoyosella rhizosphaerae TaxID=1755582 RepID=A0A916U1A2_9ACTN|nr:transglutaminase domain-containing protein [Hoyosella rhizosphaerae]MBN4926857.1 hypothetical protein [Hoyosella rhizosphaerae]GGC55968.1 hypothetical protein GCM10011410_05470 [Hoyosella rhizosphaerae]
MIFAPSSSVIDTYLASDDVINFHTREVLNTAQMLGGPEAAFTFVRDNIAHSRDAGRWSAAYKSADVLEAQNAICHGNAHLLAALLRAQGVPAGLC